MMNKIKVLYDVVKAMREKDAYNGVIEAEVSKDEGRVLQFSNEFTKDLASGWTKARVTTVVDHDGKQVKHESTTEFHQKDGHHGGAFERCGHFHGRMRQEYFYREHAGLSGSGLKGKLDRLLAVLSALNNLKVVEADKGLLLSLDICDLPEELKHNILERIKHHRHAPTPGFKGIRSVENGTVECKVNQKNEIETIELKLRGKYLGENDEHLLVSGRAVIRFSW